MSVLEALNRGPCVSIEVVPPERGAGLDELLRAVEAVMSHGPAFASVTDHMGGAAVAEADGRAVLRPARRKPGSLGSAVAIQKRFGITTVPHVLALGQDRFSLEDMLIDIHYAGFEDIFVVRGDDRRSGPRPHAAPPGGGLGDQRAGYAHAVDVVRHAADLNGGRYLSGNGHTAPTSFQIGVAGYPGKHFESPNPEADSAHLKEKIDAGASYVITQMVFDPDTYTRYVERLRNAGIRVPVIPGVKPVTSLSQASSLPGAFYIDVPADLLARLESARTRDQERAAGIAWTADLVEALIGAGAPGVHFFTMGKGLATKAVLDAVFGGTRLGAGRVA
ncbi:MAG: methylenetetrahydrofolate reductase [Spirochaetales bacterium]|nr:methylenetetrahydrofolate reductase [Spirochaetales bacterium]